MTMTTLPTEAKSVLDFWFDSTSQPFWFAKSEAFDTKIEQQFGGVLRQASVGALVNWRDSIEGRVAEIIVLD